MKCPNCDGKGYWQEDMPDKFMGKFKQTKVWECSVCHGSGEIKEQTNEECLRSCNTEQLAKVLLSFCQYPCEICKIECDDGNACTYNKALNTIVEWLKQPHSEAGK